MANTPNYGMLIPDMDTVIDVDIPGLAASLGTIDTELQHLEDNKLETSAAYVHPNHSGDVTSVADGAQTIAANAVTETKIINKAVTLAKLSDLVAGYITLPMPNIITNGNFVNTTGWTAFAGSGAVASNVYSLTLTGATYVYGYTAHDTSAAIAAGHKIFVGCTARVTNADCQKLRLAIVGTTAGTRVFGADYVPTINTWYNMSTIFDTGADWTGNYRIQHWTNYATKEVAATKVTEIKYFKALDLTAIFGAGYEPKSVTEVDYLFANYSNLWFDGTESVPYKYIDFARMRYLYDLIKVYHP